MTTKVVVGGWEDKMGKLMMVIIIMPTDDGNNDVDILMNVRLDWI